ncbi:25.3 kDa vesicle transport protein [Morella rubra]|uniref:25.3 kDa vesicle transport protein n=1 Tax=Morella rubra TaxID=262757 RepID=A0A6A1VI30_9ROSI|nr:25.3 kDa vesicle transport protein [Morella rubra]
MVKITIVGRASDGLPLAEGPRYMKEENDNFSYYKQQAELILKEISRGALAPSKMTIRVDHHCFHYLVEDGICFITLCDSSYPRKLAFHHLQDLRQEFEKFDNSLIDRITTPYSFVKFEKLERIARGTPRTPSSIWGTPRLEVIAVKWTPITIIVVVAVVLLWASLVLAEDFVISSL